MTSVFSIANQRSSVRFIMILLLFMFPHFAFDQRNNKYCICMHHPGSRTDVPKANIWKLKVFLESGPCRYLTAVLWFCNTGRTRFGLLRMCEYVLLKWTSRKTLFCSVCCFVSCRNTFFKCIFSNFLFSFIYFYFMHFTGRLWLNG